jgi:hypothetical protein
MTLLPGGLFSIIAEGAKIEWPQNAKLVTTGCEIVRAL